MVWYLSTAFEMAKHMIVVTKVKFQIITLVLIPHVSFDSVFQLVSIEHHRSLNCKSQEIIDIDIVNCILLMLGLYTL